MNEIIRAFERFLGRDLVYILAGVIPLICLGRILSSEIKCIGDVTSLEKVSWVWITLAVGVAYVLGYLMQELFCLTCFNSTAIEGEPGCIVQCLFKRSQNREWPREGLPFDSPNGELLAQIQIQKSQYESLGAHAERMTYLMQIGTALGPACIVGGFSLFAWSLCRLVSWCSGYLSPNQNISTCDSILGLVLLAAGFLFLMLGALKRAQLREYVYHASRNS